MRYFYQYNNGKYAIHTKFINNKSIKKEALGANKLQIYKCNDYEIGQQLDTLYDTDGECFGISGKYITTIDIK